MPKLIVKGIVWHRDTFELFDYEIGNNNMQKLIITEEGFLYNIDEKLTFSTVPHPNLEPLLQVSKYCKI